MPSDDLVEAYAQHDEVRQLRQEIIDKASADLPKRQESTSPVLAKLAAGYINVTVQELQQMAQGDGWADLARDIRSLAASVLTQVEP